MSGSASCIYSPNYDAPPLIYAFGVPDDVITMHCRQVFKSTYVMYTARLSPRYLPVVTSILRALAMNDLQLVATTKETQLEALPQKRALIIAVENRSCPEFRKLWRPHNDARNIADLLIGKLLIDFYKPFQTQRISDTYRYEAKNVVILLEDDDPVQVDSQPTYINVVRPTPPFFIINQSSDRTVLDEAYKSIDPRC